ncbi:MAG: GTP-binding protein [Oligoflexales bacterium]
MEPIIVLVGFLGAGKTTLLKQLIQEYLAAKWEPGLILNDYENAALDSQRFLDFLEPSQVQALSGSCICCSGVNELRQQVNSIKPRKKGITFIEANGTTDAVTLMEFLGVGLNKGFLPPIQLSVVDCRHWQNRGEHNELEANQVQVSSLIFLNHTQNCDAKKLDKIKQDILSINPSSIFRSDEDFDPFELVHLEKQGESSHHMDHQKSHWSSCSVPLPDPISSFCLNSILEALPQSILRIKGCTKLDEDEGYTYFEKIPTQDDVMVRPYRGTLVSGPMLLTVGPGSDPYVIQEVITSKLKLFS